MVFEVNNVVTFSCVFINIPRGTVDYTMLAKLHASQLTIMLTPISLIINTTVRVFSSRYRLILSVYEMMLINDQSPK